MSEVNKKTKLKLIMSKSKVEPSKVKLIPRLELMAAVIATRLAVFVRDKHKIKFRNLMVRFHDMPSLDKIRKTPVYHICSQPNW